VIEDHPFTRDAAHMRHYKCSDCGAQRPDYSIFERRNNLYCNNCLLNTAEKRAYERWHVRED
jgi:DNA-directed RNA polymerase subunit RPC12/RpoP